MKNMSTKFILILVVVGLIGIALGQSFSDYLIENSKQYCKLKDYGISIYAEPSVLSDKMQGANPKEKIEVIAKKEFGEAKAGTIYSSFTLTDKDGNKYALKEGDKFKIVSTDSVGNNKKLYTVEIQTEDGKILTEKISSDYLAPFQEGTWLYLKTGTGNKFWVQEENINMI